MPKKAINYANTIIYKIVCLDNPSFVYVGNTTEFVQRKHAHKASSLKSETKLYVKIRENGGWQRAEMVPVKIFPCESSLEARIEEERIRIDLYANMNSKRCVSIIDENKMKLHLEFAKNNKCIECVCGTSYLECNKKCHELACH